MSVPYEQRPSDSPLVHSFGWGFTQNDDPAVMHADSQWFLLFAKQNGKTKVAVGGPTTRTWYLPCAAGTEWLGIRFAIGAFLPHLPAKSFLNRVVLLPEASGKSFWLNGAAWEFPTLENADVFVNKLVREELLVRDPVISSVLCDQPQELSFSTVRRRFLRATGLTPGTIRQIERVRQAAMLLKRGVSVLDTVHELGYFDQPHLTRSLKYFMGYTPTEIVRVYQAHSS